MLSARAPWPTARRRPKSQPKSGPGRSAYAEKAVASLRAARASGYKDVQNLEVEPDLDPIRADSGFASFMQEIRKP